MNIPYRTQQNLKRLAVVLLVLAVAAMLVLLCWFLWLNRFVVYTRDGARFDMENSSENIRGELAVPPVEDNLIPIYYNEGEDTVRTGKELIQMTGFFIDAKMLQTDMDRVMTQVSELPPDTAVMLEVKNSFGSYFYSTSVSPFRTDSVDVARVDELIRMMNESERSLYTIACLPALRDYSFGLNNEQNGLPTRGGYLWADEEYRYWLNPAKEGTYNYLKATAEELRNLGFDEVVFLDYRFPDTENIVFNGDKLETLAVTAQNLVNSCSTSYFAVSFQGSEGFVAPSGRSRVYFMDVAAIEAESIAENYEVADVAVNLVFITDLYDTRFDIYSVLRPMASAT